VIQIGANCALTFGPDSPGYYNIASIPNAAVPNSLIAPFWDDMDSTSSGIVRYQAFGVAPNRYWVAEWNQVPRWNDASTAVTLQAVLFENGVIKFQYGNSTGVNADGRSACIGIEDPTGTRGCPVSYYTVGAVSNNSAITFTPTCLPADANTNGLPDAFERFYFGTLGVSPTADSDGDGQNNLAEFLAGTDPTQAASVLRFQGIQRSSPTQFIIRWQSIPGRTYNIWQWTDFVSWSKLTVDPIIGSSTGTNSYTGTVSKIPGQVILFQVRTP
jgi:hypothetical protein